MSVLSPHLQFAIDFGAPIWQMRPDYTENLLALEIRDGDRLQTEFAVVAVDTGNLVGAHYRAPENLWVGLEDTQNRRIYLHGFADRKVGSHLGITAVDIDARQISWQQEQGVYFGLAANQQIIARPAPHQADSYIALDSQTGQIVETDISPARAHALVTQYAQQRTTGATYPVHHPAESAHFNLLGQFISNNTQQIPVGAIDYLETGTFFVIAYYVPVADGKLKHLLGVYSVQDGKNLLQIVLAEAATGLGTGSFFLMQETLTFVQERKTLLGYRFK